MLVAVGAAINVAVVAAIKLAMLSTKIRSKYNTKETSLREQWFKKKLKSYIMKDQKKDN
jgi:hypothetical protein